MALNKHTRTDRPLIPVSGPGSGFFVWLGRLLQRPLFGTRVIPRDSRVNLDMLPESDFPLNCEKCGYLLRGLPKDRCPECGSDFDRHRLFLKNYVYDWFGVLARTTAVGRVIRWSCVGGIALVLTHVGAMLLVGLVGHHILNLRTGQPIAPGLVSRGTGLMAAIERCVWLAEGILLLCILIGFAWSTKEIARRLRKRRRVIEAIIPSGRAE